MVEREQTAVPTPPLDDSHHEHVSLENVPETDPSRMPPTPISSAASVVHRDGEVAENGSSMVDGGMASITQALRNFVLPKSAFGMKERRHQSLPVSSVTKSTVTAAHISNPTSSTQSSRPHSPPSSSPSSAKLPSSQTVPETHELTSSVATVPRDKSTPPHTPRALSQEDRRDQTRSPSRAPAPPRIITKLPNRNRNRNRNPSHNHKNNCVLTFRPSPPHAASCQSRSPRVGT